MMRVIHNTVLIFFILSAKYYEYTRWDFVMDEDAKMHLIEVREILKYFYINIIGIICVKDRVSQKTKNTLPSCHQKMRGKSPVKNRRYKQFKQSKNNRKQRKCV